jgi:extradiol dioxygenase family protein
MNTLENNTDSMVPQSVGIFHLAIPTHDLDATEKFYKSVFDSELARRYADRVTFSFFGHQIVCHLAPDKIDQSVELYPRHFGITFIQKLEFDKVYHRCKHSGYHLFKDLFIRWPDKPEKHETFFIADPSNNVIEFKYYFDTSYIY